MYQINYDFVTGRKSIEIESETELAIFLEQSDKDIKNNQRRQERNQVVSLNELEEQRGPFLRAKEISEEHQDLNRILKTLSVEEKHFLYQRYIKEMKLHEIAKEYGLHLSSISRRAKKFEKIKTPFRRISFLKQNTEKVLPQKGFLGVCFLSNR